MKTQQHMCSLVSCAYVFILDYNTCMFRFEAHNNNYILDIFVGIAVYTRADVFIHDYQ